MDKFFFLSHRTTQAIERSQKFLNDSNLFGALTMDSNLIAEGNVILGLNDGDIGNEEAEEVVFEVTPPTEDKLSGDEDNDSNEGESVVTMLLRAAVRWNWCKHKIKIEHPYAIAAWALGVMEDVCEDVRLRLKGAERGAIEEVVKHLHLSTCPNKSVDLLKTSSAEIVDTFWNEFKAFQCCMEPSHHPSQWATPDVSSGRSHIWHEKYSLPYTQVLGYVACCVTSKLCGIGPAERGWAAVKTVKNLKKYHLGSESTEKRSVIYITAKQQEASLNLAQNEKLDAKGPNAMFCDDNINFDLQLEMWDVDPDGLKEPEVQRVFQLWVEDWEEDTRMTNDAVAEARLIQKYKRLVFHDSDIGTTFLIYDQNMEFRQGRGNGWFLLAVSANDEGNEEEMETFLLELACELIGATSHKRGVWVVHPAMDEDE
jgi:hypothetical protein